MQEQEILNEYKKYNYLNKDKNNPLIKILVSYIKPSFLFKSEILTPIHLGKAVEKEASKDGIVNEQDLDWLHTNCEFNDDFESGISEHNRRVGFLTGTFWAWKNYEKLGNPEYFGSFGYRRLLKPDFLENMKNYDLILPNKKDLKFQTLKEQFVEYHGDKLFKNTINVFNQIYPNETRKLEEYFSGTSGYFDELYVMKKEIFSNFCKWIFPLLFEFIKIPQINLKNNDFRDIGFIMERLSGYYLNKLTKDIKYKEVEICISENFKVNPKIIDSNIFTKLRKNIVKK